MAHDRRKSIVRRVRIFGETGNLNSLGQNICTCTKKGTFATTVVVSGLGGVNPLIVPVDDSLVLVSVEISKSAALSRLLNKRGVLRPSI